MNVTTIADSVRWDHKYRTKLHQHSSKPDSLLLEHSHLFSESQFVLDLACGKGRHAIYLANLGCKVVALDVSKLALKQCLLKAKNENLPIFPVLADLKFYRIKPESFDTIICFNYLNRSLANNVQQALVPGGLLMFKTFNKNFLHLNPKFNPNYVLELGELCRLFDSLELVSTNENQLTEAESKSYLIARKPA